MKLNNKEIEMLQEQLVLIYKTIHQNRMVESFYFQGLDTQDSSSELIKKINELENPEETFKECIIELEEIKEDRNLKMENFNEILENYDISFLKRKYNIETVKDLDKLDIRELLRLL
jgi:hypothetical protein